MKFFNWLLGARECRHCKREIRRIDAHLFYGSWFCNRYCVLGMFDAVRG